MNFLTILCNITFKKDFILVETPTEVSCVKYTFGSEYKENQDYFTYGSWEIFLGPLKEEAKILQRHLHLPLGTYFNLVHRLYTYHVLPGLKELLSKQPNNRPHSFQFALPYFINKDNKVEVPNYHVDLGKFRRITYDKRLKFCEVTANEKKKQDRWEKAKQL